jgi:hypothetical protein
LSLDHEQYQTFKRVCASLGVSVSAKVEELIRHNIAEATGETGEAVNPVDYEALKRQHIKLVAEADKLEKRLEKTGEFDNMANFAEKLGLNLETYGNLAALAPQMLEKWHAKGGVREYMHLLIAYLELLKEKKKVESQLEEARKKMADASISPPKRISRRSVKDKTEPNQDEKSEKKEEDSPVGFSTDEVATD